MVKEGKKSKESTLNDYLKQGAFEKAVDLVKASSNATVQWPFDRIFARLPMEHLSYNDVCGCVEFLKEFVNQAGDGFG